MSRDRGERGERLDDSRPASAGADHTGHEVPEGHVHLSGHHVLRDSAGDDDWAWRRRVRKHPLARRVYRVVVFLLGLVLVLGGLALIPLPGPGWIIVIVGLAIWASEFEKAKALLDFTKEKVRAWEAWVKRQPWWVQGMVGLATAAFVAGVLWTTFRLSGGLPGFLPDHWERWGNQTLRLT